MKQKKYVIATFEFLFVRLVIETERQHKIFSSTEEDMMYFVYDEVVDDAVFHVDYHNFIKSFERYKDVDIDGNGDWLIWQRKYYDTQEEFDSRFEALVNTLKTKFEDLSEYKEYDFVSV